MRIALVSPYSWTYPGGVTRHIEALASELLRAGHDVRVLAPFDPDDRLAARLHRGARPEPRPVPEHLIPLGRTLGVPMNGAVSNLAYHPFGVVTMRRALEQGGFDVAHVHEPVAPTIGWDVLHSSPVPLVGTFHCYSTNAISNNVANLIGARRAFNHLRVRIAVSEAAAWTGRRFYGGRYRVIPNGVDLAAAPPRPAAPRDHLRVVFVGQAVERKGLPLLLRAFEALREHVPAQLTVVGAAAEEIAPMVMDARGITALGKVSDDEKWAALADADVLCAPSLGGESFGMVLTEAFAAGTPVIASDIPGYRDVVRDGRDGLLVPRGDATALAEALRDLWHEPARRAEMALAAAERAHRYAWPQVAAEVVKAYEDAIAMPAPEGALRRAATAVGVLPADGERQPARRVPSPERSPAHTRRPPLAAARRIAFACGAVLAAALALLALQRIGIPRIAESLLASSPVWVLAGLGLMCGSMLMRALAWHAILRAALPDVRVRLVDAVQGTFIGVLMSATLPARLGEPSRALIVARRLGRMRERFPVVLGTLVSQTLLNILALVVLGAAMFSTVGLFAGHQGALVAATIAPVVLLVGVLVAPGLLRSGASGRFARTHALLGQARQAAAEIRQGLQVFRRARLAAIAVIGQLSAWAVQCTACYALLVAFGLDDRAGFGAAAAVLFAVNVTAVLPAVPSNLGVFQAACVAVLTGAYGVSAADALGYGIVLQAVEIATALIMGMPALVKEGLSWRDVRLRALHAAPVQLPARSAARRRGDALEAEA
jgi:phosphatidyl-myo-inositol alpha-mannosyltransferase